MRGLSLLGFILAVIAVAALLEGCRTYEQCAPLSDAALASLPARLSQTGLDDERVLPFSPAFELWSDGAVKRRFILLPEGEVIDTSDVDDWRFPVGTKLWKEFVRDGVKVETRLLQKTGPGDADWVAAAYVHDGDDATLAVDGLVDAKGTSHDVPAADQCMSCHGGRASRVLGFSAVQLTRENGAARAEGDVDLAGLVARGLLSTESAPAIVPGDETARGALGYLHANCAHCHNQARPPQVENARCYDPEIEQFDFMLKVADLGDVASAATVRTAIGGEERPFSAENEVGGYAMYLMSSRGSPGLFQPAQMPPLATEVVDTEALALVRAFVESL